MNETSQKTDNGLNKKIIWQSMVHSIGVAIYVLGVSFILNHGNKWFGEINGIWGPALILLLLCFSAATVGLLIFGRPAYLIIIGQKEKGVKMLFFTLLWMAIITILAFAIFAFLAANFQ